MEMERHLNLLQEEESRALLGWKKIMEEGWGNEG